MIFDGIVGAAVQLLGDLRPAVALRAVLEQNSSKMGASKGDTEEDKKESIVFGDKSMQYNNYVPSCVYVGNTHIKRHSMQTQTCPLPRTKDPC